MKTRPIATFLAAATLLVAANEAGAQNFPRRGGGQRGEYGKGGEEAHKAAAAQAPEPFGALERELPSLKVDLLVREEQLDAWRVFERDVKDIAEMERSRKRHLMALRDTAERPPSAVSFVGALAEEDRAKAEATGELKRHVEQLYAKLDDAQRRTFDRRTIQSQVEPLGPSAR